MKLFFFLFTVLTFSSVFSQEFIPLWPEGKMPNSKGLKITDSIYDERYRRVGTPGLYAFFPSKQENKGTAIVICPGGGYKHEAYISSGTQMAKWFNTMGVNAFVLIYRLPHSPDLIERSKAPLQDAQRAIRMIRANAEKWGIAKDRVGVIGFSSGGHVASSVGTHTEDVSQITDNMDSIAFTPNFMVLVSPVITMGEKAHKGSVTNLLGDNPSKDLIEKYSSEKQVTEKTPPTLIFHANNDKTVNQANSLLLYQALVDKKVSASLHIFPYGEHSIGLRNNPGSTQVWNNICEMWLCEMNFIPEK
jgi:acetyl esterase/lipase